MLDNPPSLKPEETDITTDATNDQKNNFAAQVDFRNLLKKRPPTTTAKPEETKQEKVAVESSTAADASNDQKNSFAAQVDFRHLLKKKPNPTTTEVDQTPTTEENPSQN